jgi:hypothetical protein
MWRGQSSRLRHRHQERLDGSLMSAAGAQQFAEPLPQRRPMVPPEGHQPVQPNRGTGGHRWRRQGLQQSRCAQRSRSRMRSPMATPIATKGPGAAKNSEREILNGKSAPGLIGGFDPTSVEDRACRQKRKWFQVTRSRSQTPRRHATAQSFATRIAGRHPFSSPPLSFEGNGSMLPGSPASFPGWNRYLEAAFHSPETTARFQATISRSKLPTCSFDTLPFVRPARSDSDSLTRSGSPRLARDHYRNPVA